MPQDATTPWPAPRPPQGQHRSRPILLGLILLAVAGCLLIFGQQTMRPSRPVAQRIVCKAQLHSCGKSLQVYAQRYGGFFPADIDVLVQQFFAQPGQFVCPSSLQAGDNEILLRGYSADQPISPRLHELMHSCYVYIPGQKAPADPADVLMYEKNGCHPKDGGNVLFGDYHVEWVEPYSKVEELVGRTRHRLATPMDPPHRP